MSANSYPLAAKKETFASGRFYPAQKPLFYILVFHFPVLFFLFQRFALFQPVFHRNSHYYLCSERKHEQDKSEHL